MDSGVAVSVKNLSKKFRMYSSALEGLKEALHPLRKKYHNEFWALKDVSFEVKKGETVGLIGRNGSGKSTLLQILCRVLQPTSGEVKVNGRVAALLELGAGFSPEFSGRENVYMNGALMGFTREEIDAKFQSIVDFADIGDFIDQPVRSYSSGMYVRLAFSVAINVDPDILIIDEALAVGDLEFQIKSSKKIEEFKDNGRNLVIVSHDMRVIKNLCDRVILLDNGLLVKDSSVDGGIDSYFGRAAEKAAGKALSGGGESSPHGERKSKKIFFSKVKICDAEGNETGIFKNGQTAVIKTTIIAKEKIDNPVFGGIVYSESGVYLGGFNSLVSGERVASVEGLWEIEYRLEVPFLQGAYVVTLAIHDGSGRIVYDILDKSISFIVKADTASLPFTGHVKIPCSWRHTKISDGVEA